MRRSGRIDRSWLAARLPETPGIAMAGVFIGVSGMMSVIFGYRLGEPSGNALIFAAVALGIEGFADLSIPLFWRRSTWWRRVLLIVFFGVCLGYKLEAAKRFAAENLGKRDMAVATASQDYRTAFDKVESLRKTIVDYADARAAELVQLEIDALLRDPKAEGCAGKINGDVTKSVCPKVDKLRVELVRAKARDAAQTDLTPALTALRTASPAAGAGAAQQSTGPVMALLALLGIQVTSWSGLIAAMVMVIVEGGAIIVPLLIGAGAREARTPTPAGAASEPPPGKIVASTVIPTGTEAPPQPFPLGLTDRARRDIADVTAFLAATCERADGERVQATPFYGIYSEWKQGRSEDAMSVAQFGVVLTKHMGLSKMKSDGRNWYLGLRLRHPGQGRQASKHLKAVAA
jgi:hypothetical protein